MDDLGAQAFGNGVGVGRDICIRLGKREMDDPSITSPMTCGYMAQCIQMSDGPHLEIGSRFGLSAIAAAHFTKHKIVCIDPMEEIEGWYDSSYMGNVEKFKHNISEFKLEGQVELVQAYSDPLPVTGPFATTFIDGDHSTRGAFTDFMNVRDITTDYLIWDDVVVPSVYQAIVQAMDIATEWRLCVLSYTTAVMVNRENRASDWDNSLQLGGIMIAKKEDTNAKVRF